MHTSTLLLNTIRQDLAGILATTPVVFVVCAMDKIGYLFINWLLDPLAIGVACNIFLLIGYC